MKKLSDYIVFVFSMTFLLVVLFSFIPANAATYYVDTDIGNDAYNGLSMTDDGGGVGPWQTTAKVKTFSSFVAGDTISFKKGQDFSVATPTNNPFFLNYPAGTSTSSRITLTSHGAGAYPILGASRFINVSWLDGYTIKFKASTSMDAIKIETSHDVRFLSGLSFGGGGIFNPSSVKRCINIVGTAAAWSYNIIIDGMIVYDTGADHDTRMPGVNILEYSHDVLVIDSSIYDTSEIGLQAYDSSGGLTAGSPYNIFFYGNEIYGVVARSDDPGTAHGINFGFGVYNSSAYRNYSHDNESSGIATDAGSNNNLIYNNILKSNWNWGVGLYGSGTNNKVYNNTIDQGTQGSEGIRIATTSGVGHDLQNNIIIGNTEEYRFIGNQGTQANLISDYNLFYQEHVSGAYRFSWNNAVITYAQWKANISTGKEVHSVVGDPLVDSDYRLTSGSPAINAGTNLSAYFEDDYDGHLRAGLWDIGAYEFHQGVGSNNVTLDRVTVN